MAKPYKNLKVYPLSMSQKQIMVSNLVCMHKIAMYIPFYFVTDRQFEFDLMKKALNEEFKRNDSFRMRFFNKGLTKYQYFLPEFTLDNIPCLTFKDKKEQDEVLSAESQKVPSRGAYPFKLIIFKRKDGPNGVYIQANHLIMDAMAIGIFFNDLVKVYDALENGTEMPKPLFPFEQSLQREFAYEADEEKQKKGIEFFTKHFLEGGKKCYVALEGSRTLKAYRKKKKDPNLNCILSVDPLHEKTDLASYVVPASLMREINDCCREQDLVTQHFVGSALRIYFAAVNDNCNDVDIYEMCSRRPMRDDKNTGGCRVHTYQIRSQFKDEDSFLDVATNLANEHLQVYRHSNTDPMKVLTLDISLYGDKVGYAYCSSLFTYMPNVAIPGDTWKIEKGGYNPGAYIFSMYIFYHENPKTGALTCDYEYRIKNVTRTDVDNCQNSIIAMMKAAVENPRITVGELKKLIVLK